MSVAGVVVAVLGGDRRMLSTAAALAAAGAWVRVTHLPGDAAPPGTVRCTGAEEALTGARVAVLPVQPVGADGRVHTEPPVPPLYIRPAALERLAPGATVFAGALAPELRAEVAARGLELVEYRERDDFAIYNSVPSAEGAIQMAMAASPLCLFGSTCLVVGYGRTGTTLAHMLRGLGAQVAVVARREADLARAWAAGHRPVPAHRLAEAAAEADFVFNTVPALVITRAVLAQMARHVVVIDLASAPGGVDFAAAEELGICAQLAPGLPGKVAPVTAGRIIADLVVRHLAGQSGAEGPPGQAP